MWSEHKFRHTGGPFPTQTLRARDKDLRAHRDALVKHAFAKQMGQR